MNRFDLWENLDDLRDVNDAVGCLTSRFKCDPFELRFERSERFAFFVAVRCESLADFGLPEALLVRLESPPDEGWSVGSSCFGDSTTAEGWASGMAESDFASTED